MENVSAIPSQYFLEVVLNNKICRLQQIILLQHIYLSRIFFAGREINYITNYRFVLSVKNKLINQHLVLNDEIRNGLVNTLKLEINDDDLDFKPGDLISIEMQCIDKKVSMFYTALALMNDSGPGGGTTPNNPPNNISNGALGIFSAHTVENKSTVIP